MTSFDAIRPFRDDEVPGVLRKLSANRELQTAVAHFSLPRLSRYLPGLSRVLVRRQMHKRMRSMTSIADFQSEMVRYFQRMLRKTSSKLSYTGLEKLDPNRGYLFISNHRDIALDSSCLNYALFEQNFQTSHSAIGDNLTKVPYVEDLLRLNKSFKIQRNVKGVKKAYAAISLTSRYIRHALEQQHSIWIAQREGRSKDGYDRTEVALLKMLALAWRKQIPDFSELLATIDVVPVSISYEFDPCDVYKARELYALEVNGRFKKPRGEDIRSIVMGITGYNGSVQLHVGAPLKGEYDGADALALALDRAIVSGLKVHPSNWFAVAALASGEYAVPPGVAQVNWAALYAQMPQQVKNEQRDMAALFRSRLEPLPAHLRPYVLLQYANMVRNRAELGVDL